jgi:ankyrin repeat protein
VVQYLVQHGVDMNVGDNYGSTRFHASCLHGRLNVVQFLLQQEFDMNIGDHHGRTGFHYVCRYGKLNVVQFFLQKEFEGINERTTDGMTGLEMLVVQQNDYADNELFMPCILLLIEAGAELDKNDVFEELISAIQNRIAEITFMKEILFQKWTGRIAQSITDFVMDPIRNTSLQNLSQFLD